MLGRVARRLWPLLTVGGLLAGVAVLSVLSRPGFHNVPVPPSVRQKLTLPTPTVAITLLNPTDTANPTPAGVHRSSLLVTVAGWACAVAGTAVLLFLIWYFVKMWLESSAVRLAAKTAATAPVMSRRAAVLAAVDAGISELARADGDPRSAIIACWVRLEDVADAAGTPRGPGDTSSDLVARLLGDHQVSQPVLTSLAALYRTARYSTAWIETSMRDEALVAFEHLRAELVRSRSGPLAEDPEFEAAVVGSGHGADRHGTDDHAAYGPRSRPAPRRDRP